MKLEHLKVPPTGRPPLWYCLAAWFAKGLAHGAGLLLLLAGLSALFWSGGIESGLSARLALGGLAFLVLGLSLGVVLLMPWKK